MKLEKAKVSKAHSIVPEIAHLINSEAADVAVTDFGTHRLVIASILRGRIMLLRLRLQLQSFCFNNT
jgi:hypothetical protein